MKNKGDICVKTFHLTYTQLQASIIPFILASGCASDAVLLQKQEACLYILPKGEPIIHDEIWNGMSDTDFKAAKAWWNDCNINATQETKSKAKSATAWEKAEVHIAKGNYDDAWTLIATAKPEDEARTKNILVKNPKLYEAAINQFSIDAVTRKKQRGYEASYLFNQLDRFKKYAKRNDLDKSKYNIELVFGKEFVNGKLSDKIVYGKIVGVTFENKSHINPGAGANLGAIAGQATYIDNTTWRNYSGLNQIGAGLLGAIVGSSLDQPTRIQYQRTYWITLITGETISVGSIVPDQTHIPQGICVEVKGSSLVATNESKCKLK
jgi:hypothetical protein